MRELREHFCQAFSIINILWLRYQSQLKKQGLAETFCILIVKSVEAITLEIGLKNLRLAPTAHLGPIMEL